MGLAVVGHEDDRVALEELLDPTGRGDQRADRRVATGEGRAGLVRPGRMRGEVVVGQVVDEEVEAVAGDQPAADHGRVRVDGPLRPVADRDRRARPVRLEQAVVEEALGPVGDAPQPGNERLVRVPPSVARHVHGRRRVAGVLQRLEEGDRLRPEVLGVHVEDRVEDRAPRPGGADGAEGGAVLDEAPLAAVVPDQVRDLVDVRVRAGGDRGEADRRQRGERRGRTAVAAGAGERGQRGQALLDCALEHRGREPVDDDEDRAGLAGKGSEPCIALHAALPRAASQEWNGHRLQVSERPGRTRVPRPRAPPTRPAIRSRPGFPRGTERRGRPPRRDAPPSNTAGGTCAASPHSPSRRPAPRPGRRTEHDRRGQAGSPAADERGREHAEGDSQARARLLASTTPRRAV